MQKHKILEGLDSLIKRASEQKQAALKQAESVSAKLDNAEDGTTSASTGAQAAANLGASKEQYAEPANDVGAEASDTGESVEMSSEEATAVSPSGQEGTQGSEMASAGIDEADNGPEDTDSPANDGWDSGAFKGAAKEAREMAESLRKQASELLSPLDRFLAKAARASDDQELKKVAMQMDDQELANAASDSLTSQLEGGAIGDDEASQILAEALQEGAVSEEEISAAAQAMQGADQGQMMEAKLAAAEISPDHPRYLEKIASFYPQEISEGYNFALKLAQEMSEEYEEEPEVKEEVAEEAAAEGEPVAQEVAEEMVTPEEVQQVEEVISAPGEDEGEESAEADVEGTPEEDLAMLGAEEMTPANPEEEAALNAVGQELGLDEQALAQLLEAPVPPEAGVEMGKVARAMKTAGVSPASRYRTIILQKVAALRQ